MNRLALATTTRRSVVLAAILALALGAFGTRYFALDLMYAKQNQAAIKITDGFYIPPVPVLRVISLGYSSFMADLLYIRAFAYFVDHLFGDRRYEWLDAYVDTVIELDPYVPTIYRWASQSVKLGQLITRDTIKKSNHYAELGLKYFPNDWRLYMDIGFNYYYEWHPENDEEKARTRALALDYFSVAASLPDSQLSPSFLTALFLDNDDKQLALFHAYSQYIDATDEQRDDILRRIRQIESEEAVMALQRREEEWKTTFPFVPRPFFELLGPTDFYRIPKSWDELDQVFEATSELTVLISPEKEVNP